MFQTKSNQSQTIRLMNKLFILLASFLISSCSFFGQEDDPAITPAELEDFESRVEFERLWVTKTGSKKEGYLITLRPFVSREHIFIADYEGKVISLDPETGKKNWESDLDTNLSGGVGYAFGTVYVGNLEGEVFALNEESGSLIWSTTVSSEVLARPNSNGKVVIINSIDNQMAALDVKTGDLIWKHDGDAPILSVRGVSDSIVTDTMVISGFDSGKLISFNASNGSINWETRVALPKGRTELERMVDIDGAPILIGDVIYVVSYQGNLAAYSRGTGSNLWFQDASSHFSPTHLNNRVFITDEDDSVVAFNAGNGRIDWSNEKLFLRRLTGPTVVSSYVAVGDFEGYVHLLDASDGSFVGRTRVERSGITASLSSYRDILFVHSDKGTFSAYKIQ